MFVEKQIFLPVGKRNYADSGAGEIPLLLLHGVTRRWQCFQPILPALAPFYRIYALDFRGHGLSDPFASGYRVIDYVDDVVEFIDRVIGGPAIVYGHSLGSMVAAATAARIPDRVRATILEDPPFDTMGKLIAETPLLNYFSALREWAGSDRPVSEIAGQMGKIRMAIPGVHPQMVLEELRDAAWLRFAAKSVSQLDPEVLTPIAEKAWLDGYDQHELLSSIRCPTLLLQANWDRGGMLNDHDASICAETIADCSLLKFDCHHLIHWFAVEELRSACFHFLGSI